LTYLRRIVNLFVITALASVVAHAEPDRPKPAVVELFEDDAEGLIRVLNHQHSYPGGAQVESEDVFSGRRSILITPVQRQSPAIPGWAFRIAERPGPGEFRYLRFAWKADGCAGIMFQFHDDTYYNVRYTAGENRYGWATKFLADRPPSDWQLVTRDLFADFGPLTIHGLSLTAFDGKAYFDHIYLGRTVADLDRINANGTRPSGRLTVDDLDRLWEDLGGASARRAYAAQWKLVAAVDQSAPFLAEKLSRDPVGPLADDIRRWIRELDADDFRVRASAHAALAAHLEAAATALEAARASASPEVRARVAKLLSARAGRLTERERCERAVRVLELADGPAAARAIQSLARSGRPAVAQLAAAALERRRAY
jgi:hypothetical protein